MSKLNLLIERLHAEQEHQLKFIFEGISNLFTQASEQKIKYLMTRWNKNLFISLSHLNRNPIIPIDVQELDESTINQEIKKEFKKMVQDFDDKEIFGLSYQSQNIKISYSDLKRYAQLIALNLPKGEKDFVKKILNPNHWTQNVQEISVLFNHKYKPIMEIKDFTHGKKNIGGARVFCFTDINSQKRKTKVCLLLRCEINGYR